MVFQYYKPTIFGILPVILPLNVSILASSAGAGGLRRHRLGGLGGHSPAVRRGREATLRVLTMVNWLVVWLPFLAFSH